MELNVSWIHDSIDFILLPSQLSFSLSLCLFGSISILFEIKTQITQKLSFKFFLPHNNICWIEIHKVIRISLVFHVGVCVWLCECEKKWVQNIYTYIYNHHPSILPQLWIRNSIAKMVIWTFLNTSISFIGNQSKHLTSCKLYNCYYRHCSNQQIADISAQILKYKCSIGLLKSKQC